MALLKDILQEIDGKINLLQSLLPLKPADQQRLDKKFRLEFNYNSNHMEGNTLTYGETELLLFFDKTNGGHELREYEEMKAHDIALKMVREEAADTERPLTEQFIRSLNKCILVRPFWKEAITPDGQATQKQIIPGQYKTSPNSVRLPNGEIFDYASPEDTPAKMQELVVWYNENCKKEHPLFIASLLHYNFVRIHPFDDGNGRVARLLMNYVLLKNSLPLVVIKSKQKNDYLTALNHADVGEIDVFVTYIGEQLLWSLDLTNKAANGEDIEDQDDIDKKLSLLTKRINLKEPYLKKTPETLKLLLTESIHPLLDDLAAYLKKFLVTYDSLNYSFVVNHKSFYNDDFESFKASPILTINSLGIDSLSVQFFFRGFKPDMASGFATSGIVELLFEEYRYGIKMPNKNIRYWSYDHDLSEGEKKSILSEIGNPIYEEIEQMVNRADGN